MRFGWLWVVVVVVGCLVLEIDVQRVHGQAYLFDFGDATISQPEHVNVVAYNNQHVDDVIDETGASHGIGFHLTSDTGFNEIGINSNGPNPPEGTMAALFSVEMTRDNLFGHSDNFNVGAPRPSAEFTLSGLDPTGATAYSFIFSAGRTGVTDNRETQYEVIGRTAGLSFLDASSNTSEVAFMEPIVPDVNGELKLIVRAGPSNTNGSKFYYLGAMRMDTVAIPEPSGVLMFVCGGTLLGLLRRRS
jgi:hypothetical protein